METLKPKLNGKMNTRAIEALEERYRDRKENIIKIGEYSGGNDSGMVRILEDLPEDVLLHLESIVEGDLGYGSWAGNFEASGNIYYNKENKSILIEGSEINEEYESHFGSIEVDLSGIRGEYFDSVTVSVEVIDDVREATLSVNMRSGFKTDRIKKAEEEFPYLVKRNVSGMEAPNLRCFFTETYTAEDMDAMDWVVKIPVCILEEREVSGEIPLLD